eukprot:4638646-Pleurochrysis_carterae.AAC.2
MITYLYVTALKLTVTWSQCKRPSPEPDLKSESFKEAPLESCLSTYPPSKAAISHTYALLSWPRLAAPPQI